MITIHNQRRRAAEIERIGGQRRLEQWELDEYMALAHLSYARFKRGRLN